MGIREQYYDACRHLGLNVLKCKRKGFKEQFLFNYLFIDYIISAIENNHYALIYKMLKTCNYCNFIATVSLKYGSKLALSDYLIDANLINKHKYYIIQTLHTHKNYYKIFLLQNTDFTYQHLPEQFDFKYIRTLFKNKNLPVHVMNYRITQYMNQCRLIRKGNLFYKVNSNSYLSAIDSLLVQHLC